MTNQQWINKLRVDMKEITKKTAALDKTLVQSRTKVMELTI